MERIPDASEFYDAPRGPIRIGKHAPLQVETDLRALLRAPGLEEEVRHRAADWRARGFKHVVVFVGSDSRTLNTENTLIESVRRGGFPVIKVPIAVALSNDYARWERAHRLILDRIIEAGAAVLCEWESYPSLYTFMAGLFLADNPKLSPEQAARTFRGGDLPGDGTSVLRSYARFLSGDQAAIPAPSAESKAVSPAKPAIRPRPVQKAPAGAESDGSVEAWDRAGVTPDVQTGPPAPGTATTVPREAITHSWWTLRKKLMFTVSAVLLSAMTGMILLAGYFFKDESERRIQELNHNLSRVLASKVQVALQSMMFRGANAARGFRSLAADEEILFVGFAGPGTSLQFVKTVVNEKLLRRYGMNSRRFGDIGTKERAAIKRALAGGIVVRNLSPQFGVPLLGVALPASIGGRSGALLIVADSRSLRADLRSQGKTQSFLVDERGAVIIHPRLEFMLSAHDLSQLEIVRRMRASRNSNLQMPYSHDGTAYLGSFRKLTDLGVGMITFARQADAFEAVYHMQRQNFYIMLLVLNVAIVIMFFFARRIVRPIRNLASAAGRVEQGDFSVDLVPATGDEIGVLTDSFRRMTSGLAEREKMKDAMNRFFNPEIAEKYMRGELTMQGEYRNCAVLFSDLRGFTQMSAQMEPHQVLELLNEYFTEMTNWVLLSNGILDKFIGDALMAFWSKEVEGEPVQQNPVERAATAALMMRESLAALNQRSSSARPKLRFGVGINYGDVISGLIGSQQRLQYTIIGDAVNRAARLQDYSKTIGTDIVIDGQAYREIEGDFLAEELPPAPLRGITGRVPCFALLGRRDDPGAPRSLADLQSRLGLQVKRAAAV